MTNIELLTSTPELTAALTAVRDELMAANSAAIANAVAAVNAERDTLSAQLAATTDSLATITADRDRLAALLAEASAAFDAGDIATLTTMRAAALQTENEKKLAAALAKKAEAEAEIASLTE
jgi:hypothetical protein